MHDEDNEPSEPEIPDELRELFEKWEGSERGGYWIFKDGKLQAVNMLTWTLWLDSPDRIVDKTTVSDDVQVSTVFVGLDFDSSALAKKRLPYCWETLIFGGPWNGRLWRYARWGDAKRGHWQVVDALKAGQEPRPEQSIRSGFDLLKDLMEGRFDLDELQRELGLDEDSEEDDPE
jgi:hypothetical protein